MFFCDLKYKNKINKLNASQNVVSLIVELQATDPSNEQQLESERARERESEKNLLRIKNKTSNNRILRIFWLLPAGGLSDHSFKTSCGSRKLFQLNFSYFSSKNQLENLKILFFKKSPLLKGVVKPKLYFNVFTVRIPPSKITT